MAIRNQNWYNLQATRRYPLDDRSTGDDDNGVTLHDDIIVDCNVRFPSTLGQHLYVQALTVSPGIVTLLLGVGQQLFSRDGITVATISLPLPITTNRNYSVTALVPGIAGWVAFGAGINTPFTARFTTPAQSLISPRCGQMYAALPIQTIAKLGLRSTLSGIIELTTTAPLTAKYEKTIAGVPAIVPLSGETFEIINAITIGIDQNLITPTFNPLKDFLGPCAQRPESKTCEQVPIESINGVRPDCNGNIDIIFDGVDARLFNDCGGIDFVSGISLQQSCQNIPDPRKEFIDICCEADRNSEGTIDEFCWPDVTPDIIATEDLTYPCVEFPICFNSCDATAYFNSVSGAFLATITNAPELNASGRITASSLSQHYVLTSTPSLASIALLKNCATDWAANKTIRTVLKLSNLGVEKNGGVVLNYRTRSVGGRIIRNYVAVVIEAQSSQIRVLRFSDDTFIEEHAIPFTAKIDTWYELRVTPIMSGSTTAALNIVATDMLTGTTTTGTATVAEYGTPTGGIGLFAQRSYTHFNSFDAL
jgi:hypothetical protein